MPPTIDQRASSREITVNDQTYVQLMGPKGMSITRGRLLNISTGGALIHVDRAGEPYSPNWIRLERAPETGWIAADLARFNRPQEVAIKFRSPCPLEFFLAATLRGDPRRSGNRGAESSLRDDVMSEDVTPAENRQGERDGGLTLNGSN
jgi:hypothetical protein